MLKTVFEDEHLLVLEKPPGLVVTSSETQKEPSLEDILAKEYKIDVERSGIVHRLDKDTSGLILIAKDPQTLENLQSQFKERTVKKEYLALVHGLVEEKGTIDAPIGRNPGDREKFIVMSRPSDINLNSREAVTEYEPIEKFKVQSEKLKVIFEGFNKIQFRKLENSGYGQFTLLQCKPFTGRTHQIRVHLKYIGFPIVGDDKYGGRKVSRLDHRWCTRQFLHAARIEFNHPVTQERLVFESTLPEDLNQALSILKNG